MARGVKSDNRYKALIESIFFAHWKRGLSEFVFEREEIKTTASKLGIHLPDNLGDLIYSFRFRTDLPESIVRTQSKDRVWLIELAGRGRYRFKLYREARIAPNPHLATIGIPDATPEIIRAYALDDEQALLAIVRYNRLIDTFLGLTTFSLQSHLRTTVDGIGQIEVDELYMGIDKRGRHYAIPVQAKGGKDQIGIVQTAQDLRFVEKKFAGVRCRPVAAQFMSGGTVALFELTLDGDEIKVVEERHYRLVASSELDQALIRQYDP